MWYVLQTMTGKEEELIRMIKRILSPELYTDCFIAYYERVWRKQQHSIVHVERLFPGYAFIVSEQPEEVDYDAFMAAIEGCIPIYVLSNRYRINGAACILYPTLLEDICDSLQGSFYIIPSSVHEVLILPSDNTDDSIKIREMIKEVNDTQIAAEEILSYSLYFYDREENRLHIV